MTGPRNGRPKNPSPLVAVAFCEIEATGLPIGEMLKDRRVIWHLRGRGKQRQNVVRVASVLDWIYSDVAASGDAVIE